jgi:hypothetical protein
MLHWFIKGKKPIKCDICDYGCYQKSDMKLHVVSVHDRNKQLKCKIREYRSSENSNIQRHTKSVHEQKKRFLKCEYCAVSFVQTCYLKHVHKGKKPFQIQLDTSYTKWRCVQRTRT